MTKQKKTKEDPVYEFSEPHVTGGVSTVQITRSQIIKHMHSFNPWYKTIPEDKVVTEFCAVHFAHKAKEK